ncbi:helix-turn-helix domain-containing protein [Gordonia sp. DT30]|uniref:helix-turn-helix domain-containing protein n=1 Tax=Gordonia sp. DT30 TaxID=3416546 RepID=UPI003CFB689E
MEQELDAVVRQRIRALRVAKGWTLDSLAHRCHLSPSTLSRIETGHRRVALDQLVPIARALGTSLDVLVEPVGDADVVIRPEPHTTEGLTVWPLSRDSTPSGVVVAKMRLEESVRDAADELRVHPGHEWFTVLSGTIRLQLGARTIIIPAGHAAEFACTVPHVLAPQDGPAEVLSIFDHDGERAHLRGSPASAASFA